MPMKDALLPEFDHEMAVTRRVLERVPESQFAWKPHERSMSLGQLATHIATLTTWTRHLLRSSEFDIESPAGQVRPPVPPTTAALLEAFDTQVAAARDLIAATSDAEMMQPWTLRSGAHVVFSMPRAAVLRSFIFSHTIHHRGQMSVYLRLRDVPVPSIYGPSADEQ